jgi:serine/threonine-protein kinase
MAVAVGDVLANKYRVDRVLGAGGMGMVVAATHLELDQKVALKFMLADLARSQQLMERFMREARATVKLKSEHVCRVFDVGKLEDGAPYIVMELMEGRDLANVLDERRTLPVAEAVDLLLQACEGVADAHASGMVHRDLKPGNLFVARDEDGGPLVKVLDFGISKSLLAGSVTRTGEIMGSPSYMSPEQMASSKDVDARSDVWALGVIAYEMLAGALPFSGDNLPAICLAVTTSEPRPLREARANVPVAVANAVMRCLDKQPARRPVDLAELAAELAPFGTAEGRASAKRIHNRLRAESRATRPEKTLLHGSAGAPSAGLAVTQAPDDIARPRGGASSTLRASAAEISSREMPMERRSRMPVFTAVGVAVVAAVIALSVASHGGSDGDRPPVKPPPPPQPVATQPMRQPLVPVAVPPDAGPTDAPAVPDAAIPAPVVVAPRRPVVVASPVHAAVAASLPAPVVTPAAPAAPAAGSGSAAAPADRWSHMHHATH